MQSVEAALDQLGQDILTLRRDLYRLRQEQAQTTRALRACNQRVRAVHRYRQALVEVTWAEDIDEARAAARRVLTEH